MYPKFEVVWSNFIYSLNNKMTFDPKMDPVDFFRESLKAARYGNYETIINDGNSYSRLWKRRYEQLQQLNYILTVWMSSVLPFMSTLPKDLLPCLNVFFTQWAIQNSEHIADNRDSLIASSVLCGYYACECMILAQGPIGKIRELAELLLIPLARRLTEQTWQTVIQEQKYFIFSNLHLPVPNKLGISEKNYIAQDALLLFENARQVGEKYKADTGRASCFQLKVYK